MILYLYNMAIRYILFGLLVQLDCFQIRWFKNCKSCWLLLLLPKKMFYLVSIMVQENVFYPLHTFCFSGSRLNTSIANFGHECVVCYASLKKNKQHPNVEDIFIFLQQCHLQLNVLHCPPCKTTKEMHKCLLLRPFALYGSLDTYLPCQNRFQNLMF